VTNPRFDLTRFGPRATLDKTRPVGLILQVKRKHVGRDVCLRMARKHI